MKIHINGCLLDGVNSVRVQKDPETGLSKLYITIAEVEFMLLLDKLDLEFFHEEGANRLRQALFKCPTCQHETPKIEIEAL